MTTHNELMAEAMQNYAMAHHYLSKMKVTLDQLSAVQAGIATASRPPVRCVREWQDWLAANGPALKNDVFEGTGVKFTERGTPYTVEWTPSLADEPDDRFAPNTLMKINGPLSGERGAPPKVFFLWAQRFSVRPLFGVGPIKPEGEPEPDLTGLTNAEATEALYGPYDAEDDDAPVDEPEAPVRFASMDAWDAEWALFFDSLVATETKPTDEQKQALRDTLPDGADANAALAIAYRHAVERSRQAPMLGVVMPPDEPTEGARECVGCGATWNDRVGSGEHHWDSCPLIT